MFKKKLKFNHGDLFSNNIPSWLYIFNKFSLFNKRLIALEIGSYEGRSSYFLLKNLKKQILLALILLNHFMNYKTMMKKNLIRFIKILKAIL